MIRGILAGMFWGGVLGGVGLVAVSLTTPLPVSPVAETPVEVSPDPATPPAAPPEPDTPPVVATPAPTPAEPVADPASQPAVPEPVDTPDAGHVEPAEPALPEAPATDLPEVPAQQPLTPEAMPDAEAPPTEPPATAPPDAEGEAGDDADTAPVLADGADQPPATLPQAVAPVDRPVAPSAPDSGPVDLPPSSILPAPVPDLPGSTGDLSPVAPVPTEAPAAPPALAVPSEAAPVLPPADPVPELAAPSPPPLAEEERMADGPRVLPDAPVPTPQTLPDTPEPEAEGTPPPRPAPGFSGAVEGVRTGRLPRIAAPENAPLAEPQATVPVGALARNARPFANPDAKPPFAVLLLDSADMSVDLAELAASDLALTLVVDPSHPDAQDRAAVWRAAGQEVALLASGLPRRGGPADMEIAMEALEAQFPQALAVVDLPDGGMQGDRAWAGALAPALAARGFALVTWDRGLNAADQIARRGGLPTVSIFRDLDAKEETSPVIRRYLDRAAFKAQQDGRAVVLGRLRPETVTALLEWALDGRAASLALAPLTAALTSE